MAARFTPRGRWLSGVLAVGLLALAVGHRGFCRSAWRRQRNDADPVPQRELRQRQWQEVHWDRQSRVKGTTLTVHVKLQGRTPEITSFTSNAGNCDFVKPSQVQGGMQVATARGRAQSMFPASVWSFFAEASGAGHSNDSLIVNL